MKIKKGCHTFSLKAKSSYSEIQDIVEHGKFKLDKREKFCLNSRYSAPEFKKLGTEI